MLVYVKFNIPPRTKGELCSWDFKWKEQNGLNWKDSFNYEERNVGSAKFPPFEKISSDEPKFFLRWGNCTTSGLIGATCTEGQVQKNEEEMNTFFAQYGCIPLDGYSRASDYNLLDKVIAYYYGFQLKSEYQECTSS